MLRRAGISLADKTETECKLPRGGANGRHVLSVKLCRIHAFLQDHHPKMQTPVLQPVNWWAVFHSGAFSREDQLIIQIYRGLFFQTLTWIYLQQWLKLCFPADLKYNIRLNSDLLCQVCQGNIWLCTVQANPSENWRQIRTLKTQGPIANTSWSYLLGLRQCVILSWS